MALDVKVGQFTPISGSQTIDPGFEPKVLLLWTSGRTAVGSGSAHAVFSYGHATYRGAAAVQYHLCFASEDAIGTADVYDGGGTGSILKLTNGTTATVVFNMTFTSFGAGGFTVNVATATLLPIVNYIAIGGSDLEDALAGTTNWAANGAGTQSVTVAAGFGQPSLVFFPQSWNGSGTPAAQNGVEALGWGVKSGSANGRGVRLGSTHAATTQATGQIVCNSRAVDISDPGVSGGTLGWQYGVGADSGWPTDGFTANKINAGTNYTPFPFYWLALRFSANVTVTTSETAARTTTGLTTLTSANTPKLAFILGTMQTTANTLDITGATCAEMQIGAVDGAGNKASAGFYDDDAQATSSVCGTWQSSTMSYRTVTTSTDATESEAAGQVNGSNFELNFTDAAASAWLYEWFTLGVAAAAAAEVPNLQMAPYQGAF